MHFWVFDPGGGKAACVCWEVGGWSQGCMISWEILDLGSETERTQRKSRERPAPRGAWQLAPRGGH